MATRQTAHDDTDVAGPRVSQRALTIGLCATIVAIAFEAISVATAMPVAARDLDGLRYYAWAFSLFLIGMLFATVVCGRLSDRIGPAKPLLGGLVIFLAGLLVSGTAQHMAQLLAGRLVQGLGSGTMNVAIFVCVAQVFSRTQRPKIFTYISTALVLPSFVGPPAAAWLTERLSWHWVFLAVIPAVFFGAPMALPSLLRMMRYHQPLTHRCAAACTIVGCRAGPASLRLRCSSPVSNSTRSDSDYWSAVWQCSWLALPQLMPPGFLRFHRGLSQVIQTRGLLRARSLVPRHSCPLMLVDSAVPLVQAGAVLTVGAVG